MDDVESEIVDEIANAHGYDNRLIRGDPAQRPTVKMIEVGMGHEDKIDVGQMMNLKARLFQSLDDLEPSCPVRIDEHVAIVRLNKK